MEQNCSTISELLPEYAANSTTTRQNGIIVRHVASCSSCRADLVFWFTVGRAVMQSPIPAPDFSEVYAKIPFTETGLDRILRNISHKTPFDLVSYAFQTLRTTYRLASQI